MTDQFTAAGLGDEVRAELRARGARNVDDALSILDGGTYDLTNVGPEQVRAIVHEFAGWRRHLFDEEPLGLDAA